MIKRRRKPRRGKCTPKKRNEVRLAVYERNGGCCELNVRPDCIPGILPFKGTTPYDHGHLVHRKSEGSGGKTDMENCCWGCWKCHLLGLHRREFSATDKPCPPKVLKGQIEKKDWMAPYYGN